MRYSKKVKDMEEQIKKAVKEKKTIDASKAEKVLADVEEKENCVYRVHNGKLLEINLAHPDKKKKVEMNQKVKEMKKNLQKLKSQEKVEYAKTKGAEVGLKESRKEQREKKKQEKLKKDLEILEKKKKQIEKKEKQIAKLSE